MPSLQTLGRVAGLAKILAADPGQVRYILEWRRVLRQSTLDSGMPWLPFRVIDRFSEHLTLSSRVFEYGGGGSTLWFSTRAGEVVTIDHDDQWFPALKEATADLPSCTVLYRSSDNDYAEYVAAIRDYPDDHFDIVVVDGRERVRCFKESMTKVKIGGLLVLDDTNRGHYAEAFAVAVAAGWGHRTYRGLTPAKAVPGVTTIWQRPTT